MISGSHCHMAWHVVVVLFNHAGTSTTSLRTRIHIRSLTHSRIFPWCESPLNVVLLCACSQNPNVAGQVLFIGFANLIGDALSMGLGDYYGAKAEASHALKEKNLSIQFRVLCYSPVFFDTCRIPCFLFFLVAVMSLCVCRLSPYLSLCLQVCV